MSLENEDGEKLSSKKTTYNENDNPIDGKSDGRPDAIDTCTESVPGNKMSLENEDGETLSSKETTYNENDETIEGKSDGRTDATDKYSEIPAHSILLDSRGGIPLGESAHSINFVRPSAESSTSRTMRRSASMRSKNCSDSVSSKTAEAATDARRKKRSRQSRYSTSWYIVVLSMIYMVNWISLVRRRRCACSEGGGSPHLSPASSVTMCGNKKKKVEELEVSDDDEDEWPEDEEPIAVIHVGPHKTGATTIQNTIERNETWTALRGDRYDMFEAENQKTPVISWKIAQCLINGYKKGGGQLPKGRCEKEGNMPQFREIVKRTYHRGDSLFITAAELDRKRINITELTKFLQPYRRIRVVMTYRRLHLWLPSLFRGHVQIYGHDYASGKRSFPSIVEWMDQHYNNFLDTHAMSLRRRYAELGVDVHLINIHDGDLLENLFCDAVPEAPRMCKLARDHPWGNFKEKQFEQDRMDLMRVALKVSHIPEISYTIKTYSDLEIISKKILTAMNPANDVSEEIPTNCVRGEILDRMFNATLHFEREYFPEWFHREGGEAGLRRDFDKAATTQLCSFDDKRIFEIPYWSKWFKEMRID